MTYRRLKSELCISLAVFGFALIPRVSAFSQDWAKPAIRNLHRVDLRDLGYPLVNEIPANSSAVTSLLAAGDGKIYGGTSGEEAYLFVFDPAINKVRHLGRIDRQEAIHHALVEAGDGSVVFGTGKNMLEKIPLSKGGIGTETVDKTLWSDIKSAFKDYPGGHLYRFDPKKNIAKVKLAGMPCEAEDLGVPVANNSIYALTAGPRGNTIYGLTYPDGHFFLFDLQGKKLVDLGEIDQRRVFHGPERDWRSLPRALICDDAGRVFTSGTDGMVVCYDPGTKRLAATGLRIPGDYYRAQFYSDYAVVECFARHPSGLIYGGTSDGYLFSLDPDEMRLVNLGKPRAERRLRCLAVGKGGKVYLMAGERSASKPCQFYCHDPQSGGFEDLGLLIVDRSPYYYWRGYQFDSMATGADGTIYLGESERRSHLFLFMP